MALSKKDNSNGGFTLTELLMALLILGVISTFTIPKVLNAQQGAQKKAVFRETLAALLELSHRGVMTGELDGSNNGDYIIDRMNYVRKCDDGLADGCCTGPICDNHPAIVLHTGAVIESLNNDPSPPTNGIVVDYNGLAAPNLLGEDRLELGYCYGPGNCTTILAGPQMPGAIGPTTAAGLTLYEEIFQ